MKKILGLLLCMMLIAPQAQAKMMWTPPLVSKEFATLEDLGDVVDVEKPMLTGEAALTFILNKPEVRKELSDGMSKGYKHWKADVYQSTTEHGWEVKIKATTFRPTFECYYAFDREGIDKPRMKKYGCEFNK